MKCPTSSTLSHLRFLAQQLFQDFSAPLSRKTSREYDRDGDKDRHLIENFFAKLKQYRAIATRYDKLAETFLSAIDMAASVIWLI